MADDKGKVTDKASEIAKNIWLAGVGAYGKAAGEVQEQLEKAGVETPKLFKELVKAGAALEDEASEKSAPKRSASNSVEERINKVRENFSLSRPSRSASNWPVAMRRHMSASRRCTVWVCVSGRSNSTRVPQ